MRGEYASSEFLTLGGMDDFTEVKWRFQGGGLKFQTECATVITGWEYWALISINSVWAT